MGTSEIEILRRDVLKGVSGVVLEIGVGPGHNLPIYRNILKLYALEPSQELINIARTRAQGLSFPVEFLKESAENISLADGSIDTVVSTWTLCSIPDPRVALKEIARVIRPGGIFIFIDHGASPHALIRAMQKILTPITKYFTGNCHMDRDIEGLIREAGFRLRTVSHFYERSKPLMFNTQGTAMH